MKRLLVLFAVLVPLSLFVVGCGGTGGSSGKKEMAAEQKEQMKAQMQEGMKKMMPQSPGQGMPGGAATK
jgi:hypothetical protein